MLLLLAAVGVVGLLVARRYGVVNGLWTVNRARHCPHGAHQLFRGAACAQAAGALGCASAMSCASRGHDGFPPHARRGEVSAKRMEGSWSVELFVSTLS